MNSEESVRGSVEGVRPKRLNEEIRDFVWSNRVPNPLNITLTQRQTFNGLRIDDASSEQNFRHFKNILNTKVFGNAYRRFGKELGMLVVREVSVGQRHHLHCVIEHPIHRYEFKDFKTLIAQSWGSTNFGSHPIFGNQQIHIVKPTNDLEIDGWLSYLLKDRTKESLDSSVDWMNTNIRPI